MVALEEETLTSWLQVQLHLMTAASPAMMLQQG